MIFRQVTHDDLGCASYFIGDEKAGVAAVVDPRFEVDEYLRLARYMGVTIEHIFETHNHADHVSGHGRLAAMTGATIHIHRDAAPDYDHEPFGDGDEFALGSVTVTALHTPGHRPEHTAFALTDSRRGPEPWAVLTGDTLFVGDVARPDLAVEKSEGARGIYRSLHTQLLNLPAEVEVWPGHLGGSMCGGPGMDMKVSSTIGYEATHNPSLKIDDEDLFVQQALAKLGAQPPNFHAIVALNRGPLQSDPVRPTPLSSREVQTASETGALLVDIRTDREFDAGHIPGAVCNPSTRAGFGTKLAWLTEPAQPVVLIGRDDYDSSEAASLAASVGIHDVGYLQGGMTSWHEEKRPVKSVERIAVTDLPARLQLQPELQIVDVRDDNEWRTRSLPGAHHIPWQQLNQTLDGVDLEKPIAVICASGQRAATGASLLQLRGVREVIHITDGGVGALLDTGVELPFTAPDAPADPASQPLPTATSDRSAQ